MSILLQATAGPSYVNLLKGQAEANPDRELRLLEGAQKMACWLIFLAFLRDHLGLAQRY